VIAAAGMYLYIVTIRASDDTWSAIWWLLTAIVGLAIAVGAVLLDLLRNKF
jgi:hypothetical protein